MKKRNIAIIVTIIVGVAGVMFAALLGFVVNFFLSLSDVLSSG